MADDTPDVQHLAQLRREHLRLVWEAQLDAAEVVEAQIARLERRQAKP